MIYKVVKNAEFDVYFESVEKVAKTFMQKKFAAKKRRKN